MDLLLTTSCICMKESFIHLKLGSPHLSVSLLGMLLGLRLVVTWVMLCGHKKYLRLWFRVGSTPNCSVFTWRKPSQKPNTYKQTMLPTMRRWAWHGYKLSATDREREILMVCLCSYSNCSFEFRGLALSPTECHIQCSRFAWLPFLMEPPPTFAGEREAKEAAPHLA